MLRAQTSLGMVVSLLLLGTSVSSAAETAAQKASGPVTESLSALVEGNTAFALDLYERLGTGSGENLFFSPHSISTALAMTYAGARGETAAQMARVLHLADTSGAIHADFGELMRRLRAGSGAGAGAGAGTGGETGDAGGAGDRSGAYDLTIANRLWGQQGYAFLTTFTDLLRRRYGADLESLDFARPVAASRTINGWVERETRGLIPELVTPSMLPRVTRLVLTNAIHFKGVWEQEFDPHNTREAPFYVAGGGQVAAPLMFLHEEMRYAETDDLQVLELGYAGDDLAMVILLPHARDGLPALEERLSARNLRTWLDALDARQVAVWMPRFESTSTFSLRATLAALGMPLAFDEHRADFTGMTGRPGIFISEVVHKAVVEVDEQGTEAAAATAVLALELEIPESESEPEFRADHPFIFLIRDRHTGSMLFLGRITDPTARGA